MLRRQRVFTGGGGGGVERRSAYTGVRIMVWLGRRIGERPDKLDFGCGSKGCSPKQFESRGSYVLAKIFFTQPLTKTVSKHVTGNYGYSIYNNLN